MAATRDLDQTTHETGDSADAVARVTPPAPALALLWSRGEPGRVGEVACLPRGILDVPFTLGRADEPGDDGALPLVFQRLRPTSRVLTGPLHDARISRWHLRLTALAGGRLKVERSGRGTLRVDGRTVDQAVAEPGALIEAVDLFTLLFTTRPADWPRHAAHESFAFAAADPHGIVGESPAAWRLRDELALVASRGEHVLVHGPSGAGKELAAFAVHAASSRGAGPRVSRSVATLSGSTVDVELFGNLHDCPNPGAPARDGLLGEADGGSLFLDFIDEVTPALQTRLLRAMDTGEYQRVGDTRLRTADVRWIGATSRDPGDLPHVLRTRFIHHVRVPGLDERVEDIPLLVRHLMRRIGATSPELQARLFAGDEPRVVAGLIATLVRHAFTSHVRELHGLLWRAIAASHADHLEDPSDLQRSAAPEPEPPVALTRDHVVATLAACGGVREQAWRALGLRNRDQLKRLLKKFAIS